MAKTRFVGLLEAKIKEERDKEAEYILYGGPTDYAAYKERVGQLRGLDNALKLCEQIESEME